MVLNIFDVIGQFIDWLGSALSLLLRAAASAFSALFGVFSLPFRLGQDAAWDIFGAPVSWAPLFLLGMGILLLLLILLGCALTAWICLHKK